MSEIDVHLDTSGLNCPLPVLKARKALSEMHSGQQLELLCTDAGACQDIPAFCKMTGHTLQSSSEQAGVYRFVIEKGA